MKIGVVLHPYGEDKPSGLGHYILELTQNLLAIDRKNTYLIFTKGAPRASPALSGNNWRIVPLGFGKLWRDIGFIFAPKADVYLFGTPVLPIFFKLKKTIVVTHDFPYRHIAPDTLKQRIYKPLLNFVHKLSLRKADGVVAISEYTKQEDINLFGVDERKITVIYNGFRDVGATKPAELKLKKPYFLAVGAVKERKNTLRIVQAFASALQEHNLPHHLVIVGKTGNSYSKKVMDYIKEKRIENRVLFFGHANDEQLSYLYRNAEALVFPSTIESFGFPVLEAMSCGLPVITSKYGGVAEVAGDAALLVNPESVSEIAQAFLEITENPARRSGLIARGYKQARKFSWQKTARQFLALMESTVKKSESREFRGETSGRE